MKTEQKQTKADQQRKLESGRAIVRFYPNNYVAVLCPIGHVLTGSQFEAGSAFEAELGSRHVGDRFDRLAQTCNGEGH